MIKPLTRLLDVSKYITEIQVPEAVVRCSRSYMVCVIFRTKGSEGSLPRLENQLHVQLAVNEQPLRPSVFLRVKWELITVLTCMCNVLRGLLRNPIKELNIMPGTEKLLNTC